MTARIDWEQMYADLERAKQSIQEDLFSEDLDRKVDLTLHKNPPRLYIVHAIAGELFDLRDNLSPGTESRHRTLCLEVLEETRRIAEIVTRHGLRSYRPKSPFLSDDYPVSVYGYDHSQYKIPPKKQK